MVPALHAEAVKAFDAAATWLAAALETASLTLDPGRLIGSASHLPIAGQVRPGDVVGPVEMSSIGDDLVEFASDSRGFRLKGENAVRFNRLVQRVAKTRELRDTCDEPFVQRSLLRWLHQTLAAPKSAGWIATLYEVLERDVRERQYRVPLVGVVVQEPFRLGPYTIGYFTRQDTDASVRGAPEQHQEAVRQLYTKHYQGKVCVEGRVAAVPSKAASTAIQSAQDVVRALQFSHPAAFDVRVNCPVGVYDCRRAAVPHVLFKSDSGHLSHSGIDEAAKRSIELVIAARELPLYMEFGLSAVSDYLSAASPSPLNQKAWVALGIFTRGVESSLWRDRLIGAIVALETLLLGDSPAIGRSLGQRMAVFLGGTAAERQRTAADVAVAYTLRSRFMHHGADAFEETEPINRFMSCTREVVHRCLTTREYGTESELIDALDRRLLGGDPG